MRHFRIPAFTGVEAHRDDADRGTLRLAEGCVPTGPGGLRSAPVFTSLGSINIISSDTTNNLARAVDAPDGNVVFAASRNSVVHDIRVFAAANTNIGSVGGSFNQAAELTAEDPVAPPAMTARAANLSSVGGNTLAWGDGSENAVFVSKAIGASTAAKDDVIYHREYADFPDCRFFTVGPNKTLYGAGDPANPLTVYVSEPADMVTTTRDSIYSAETISSVDILMTDATEITALSSQKNHVVVHTDAGAHVLYKPEALQASTGYRVEQAPLTAASAAVNQQVVAGERGSFPFWLGLDGQIYKDESATRGAEEKLSYTDPDQVSWKAKGRWEKELPTDLSESFATYNAELGLYWVFVQSTEYTAWAAAGSLDTWSIPSKFKGYMYTELTNSLCGPFVSGNVTAITSVANSSKVIIADEDNTVQLTNLDHFRDHDFTSVPDPWEAITPAAPGSAPSTGTKYIAATEDGKFLYRGRYLTSPFGTSTEGTTVLTTPMYFTDATLAVMETAWLNLGNEHELKQVHAIHLNFSKNSVGRVWLYVESDEGLVSGQYKGSITDKMKVYTNVIGRRIRIKMFVVTSDTNPWNLREIVVGYLQGSAV